MAVYYWEYGPDLSADGSKSKVLSSAVQVGSTITVSGYNVIGTFPNTEVYEWTKTFTEGVSGSQNIEVNEVDPTTYAGFVSYDGERRFTLTFEKPDSPEVKSTGINKIAYYALDAVSEDISSLIITGNSTEAKGAVYRLLHKPQSGCAIVFDITTQYDSDPASNEEFSYMAGIASNYPGGCSGNSCTWDYCLTYDGDDLFKFMAYGVTFEGITVCYVPTTGAVDIYPYGFDRDKSKVLVDGSNLIYEKGFNDESITIAANAFASCWMSFPVADDENLEQIGIISASAEGEGISSYIVVNASLVGTIVLGSGGTLVRVGTVLIENTTASSVTIRPMGIYVEYTRKK